MTSFGLDKIRSEQAIPPREVEPEVTIRLVDGNRVMHSMHVGGYDEKSEPPVDNGRNPKVRMIEHRARVEHRLEDENRDCGR